MDPADAQHEDWNRVVFHTPDDLTNDERWHDRPVRQPPRVSSWAEGAPARGLTLAYFENWQAAPNFGRRMQKSNLVQVLLRDHGFERASSFSDGTWSVWWCAGEVTSSDLAQLHSWQRVNKFPRATALSSKVNLWRHYAAMQLQHGRAAFGFVPDTFVLPDSLSAFADHLAAHLPSGGVGDIWILKPDSETGRLRANSNGSGSETAPAVS